MKFFRFFLFVIAIATLSSCNMFKKSNESSATTGWEYNTTEWGGMEKLPNYEMSAGPNLVLVEGGTFVMGATGDQVMFDWNNFPRRVTVSSFYIDQTEVANIDYLEYLHWISWVYLTPKTAGAVGGTGAGRSQYYQVYERALPDTLVWRSPTSYNEPLVNLYLRHPAYHDYPIVGVNWNQATEYCIWRTDRVNESQLIRSQIYETVDLEQDANNHFNTEAYLQHLYDPNNDRASDRGLANLSPNAGATGGAETRRVRKEDGIFYPSYRLPTEAEWEYAALGLIGNTMYENITERRFYPWDGNYVRLDESNDRDYGRFMANYKRGRGDYMGVAGSLNDGADIPAPVVSYYPNDYGLYNMAGNVSEWVADVYRPMSTVDVDDFNPYRGNVFKTLDETKANELDENGRPHYREVSYTNSKDNLANRRNYRKADYRNYLDGDWSSTVKGNNDPRNWSDDNMQGNTTNDMYNKGSDDQHSGATSLLSDESRVYKGGSWKDRAYYLSPGIRRYLDQNLSTDYLGFRCAMQRVGTPAPGMMY